MLLHALPRVAYLVVPGGSEHFGRTHGSPLSLLWRDCSQRNEMMRLELQLSMGTFSVSMCGLVAAFFGMNLTSSLGMPQ